MAARKGATPADTTGRYILNKTLSTPHDDVLAAQGVSWLNRTAIAWATVTLELNHTNTTDPQSETITFQHIATGGIKGTNGVYHIPCYEAKHSDHVFGSVLITAQRKPLSEITVPFLTEGWTQDIESTPFETEGAIWTYTKPDPETTDRVWSAEQVWGYAEHDIPGEGRQKRYTRKIHFVSPSLTKDVLVIYDQQDVPKKQGDGQDDEDLGSFGSS